MGRRDDIIAAARAILTESGAASLSVRGVSRRAGIGASTLRHYFPTQADLHRAVFASSFDDEIADLRIRDRSAPARERLLECLRQFLPPVDEVSVELWLKALTAVFASDADPAIRAAWHAMSSRAQERVAAWLEVLAAEGAVRPGSRERQARLLLAVVDGAALWRAIPEDRLAHGDAAEILEDAVDAILH